jgi:hypothetical protein
VSDRSVWLIVEQIDESRGNLFLGTSLTVGLEPMPIVGCDRKFFGKGLSEFQTAGLPQRL